MLATELEQLVAHLRELDRPVVPLLRPGTAAGSVAVTLGAPVPVSVAEWFSWCNGVTSQSGQVQDDVDVIPGYNPLSIDEAVQMMGDYSDDPALGQNWVPLLGSASGDIYAAVWASDQDAKVAGVLIGEPTAIEFSSVEQMVAVFNGCYREQAFYVDGQGRLAMDSGRYEEVYAQITE